MRDCVWWVYVILIPPYKLSFVVEVVKYTGKLCRCQGVVSSMVAKFIFQLSYMVEYPQ